MISLQQIIDYLTQTYSPLSILLYGSYADGTNNLHSDFDALVISRHHAQHHDASFVGGVQLDVFVYPAAYFDSEYDCSDFVQLYDSRILLDTHDIGNTLKRRVLEHLHNRPPKPEAEILSNIDWCVKMSERVKRGDAEGMFRFHWVLIDSLEIFCDAMHHPYLGPKKSLRWMADTHPAAFACYEKALKDFSEESLSGWIACLKSLL